jgi:epoxide hydrolase
MSHASSGSVVGIHVNAASVGFIPFGPVDNGMMAELTEREKASLERIQRFTTDQWGYNALQSTRPHTLAYSLTDSPAGQLAWIVEKFKEWTDDAKELPEEAVDRDEMLTNVTVYWVTRTAGPSAQIYYENAHSMSWAPPERSPVPTAVANFAQDVAIRRFAEPAHTIAQWTEFDRGGHFAAMETPDLLVSDIRKFFRALR